MAPSRGIHRLAQTLLAATFLLLLAGGQVTSTESGDAVPTWPFPLRLPMAGGVLWELGHRHVAGLVGILTLALAAALLATGRGRSAHPPATVRLGLIAFGLVLAQAGLGGVRVLLGAQDPHAGTELESAPVRAIAVGHALLAQAFLLAVATLATVTAPAWAAGCDRPASTLRRGASVLVALTFVQILLGALVRHARSDLTLLLHAVGAVVVLVQGSRLAGSVLALERDPRLRRMASALGLVLLLQLALGLASYVLTGRPGARTPELTATAVIPTLHLVLGGVTLALARILTLRLGREPAASTRESVIRTPAGAASA